MNVKHALALYGADSLNKSAHFKGLLRKLDLDDSLEEADAEGEDEDVLRSQEDEALDEPQPTSNDAFHFEGELVAESEDAVSLPFAHMSLLRTIFPPFMNFPTSGLHVGDALDSLDPSVYLPWPSSSVFAPSTEPSNDDELLPEKEGDMALTRELDEDTALDRVDGHRDVEVEKALWARINGAAPGTEGQTKDHPSADAKPAPARIVQRAPRKRRRNSVDTDGGSASEQGEDADGIEDVVPRGRRKKKAKPKGNMSDRQLLYKEPDPNGRIKSAVYILDSD